MERPEPKKRNLLISDEISQGTVGSMIKEIFEINEDDDQKIDTYKDWDRSPIMLFINSNGGSVYSGLALVDVIKQSKTPVYTICIGSCMSMGLWIWLAGEKRFVGENSTLMFHDLTKLTYGKSEALKQELSEMTRLQKILMDTIVSRSSIKEDALIDYIERKAEWYISAEEAISLSLANGYYKTDLLQVN